MKYRCLISLKFTCKLKKLLPSCYTQSLRLAHPLQHVGNDRLHRISLWLGQQPNYWGIFLEYFLLNDQDKAQLYHSTIWILSYHYPVSSSFVCTMRPTAVSLRNCKERIYWLLQFLHSLMKSNQHYIVLRDQNIHYIEVQHEYLLCVNLKNYKSLTLYQALFSTCLDQLPFSFVFILFIIQNQCT